jgi:transposase
MLTVYQQITIKTLVNQGEKKSVIARQIGCHRNTIRNVLQRDRVIDKQTRIKSSYYDNYKETIKEWLDQNITRRRIHELLKEEYGIDKSYDNLCKYMQKHFPKKKVAYGVQMTDPGEEAEIDFGYLGKLPDFEGKLVKTWGLAVVLSYSRPGYYAITYDQKLTTLTSELKKAFEYFGGVPKRLKVDNMKTAILKNQHYDLEYNQDFLEFTSHYGTVIVPCTPYHPEQKGKVESAIKYMQNNFLLGRKFKDGRDLKCQLQNWMTNYANQRTHGTTKKVPWKVFEKEEKIKLQQLPLEEFAFFNRCRRIVAANCHIHFESNYYSVPSALVGKEATVRYNDNLLRVIYQGEQIALHHLSKTKGNYVTVRSHMPNYKTYSQTEYQKRYEKKMAGIGDNAHKYFQLLILTKQSYWGRIVRAILGMTKEYGKEVVEASLSRALYFGATDLVTVRNIVSNRLYERELEPKLIISDDNSLSRNLSYYQL